MKVSLVLATIGRTQEVGRLVESLLAQTDSNFELLVMDQNQDDRLACYLEQARSGGIDVSHHRMETPGLSSARNKGIGLARHEIVAFPTDVAIPRHNRLARGRVKKVLTIGAATPRKITDRGNACFA